MTDKQPVLYLVWDLFGDDTLVGDSRTAAEAGEVGDGDAYQEDVKLSRSRLGAKEMAFQAQTLASTMGWCVIPAFSWKLGGFLATHQEDLAHLRSIRHLVDAVLVSGPTDTKHMTASLGMLGHHLPVYTTTPQAKNFPRRLMFTAPTSEPWGEAAKEVTVTGWSCATCSLWYGPGDHGERLARWCCAKETPCSLCGAMTQKHSQCFPCSEKRSIERYATRKKEPWDGEAWLYSDASSKFFPDLEAVLEEISDEHSLGDGTPPEALAEIMEEMQILICNPVHGREVEACHIFEDCLPDDDDGDRHYEAIRDPLKALNVAIENLGALSWEPSRVALDYLATVKTSEAKA